MADKLDAAGGEVARCTLYVAFRTQRPAYPLHARTDDHSDVVVAALLKRHAVGGYQVAHVY